MQPPFKISAVRYRIVWEDISGGSEPKSRFYILVAVSTLIACFGLITNSTAVIIGAMLVAPLMTPIFGIALGLIRGDTHLLGKAIRAETVGVGVAIMMGVILGWLYPALHSTPEMLARTEPQLFDLLVAVLSGFAGAYAMVDEKISPALPGVAIATAIVPPLANAGLYFSAGAYIGGTGSFLLFFANFLSILLVASITFWAFGMSGRFSELNQKVLLKRFSLPVVCFLLVGGFLTHTLIKISRNHQLGKTIENSLKEEVFTLPDTTFVGKTFSERDGKVFILADMNSSATITPSQVSRMQERLSKDIGKPAEFIVRSRLARDISALGADIKVKEMGLDGKFTIQTTHPLVRQTKIADTVIRNFLNEFVGFDLANVRVLERKGKQTIVASIFGVTPPDRSIIERLEKVLREKMSNFNLELVIRFVETELYGRNGIIHPEFSGLGTLEGDQKETTDKIIDYLEKEIEIRPELSVAGISRTLIDDVYYFLVEVSGPRTIFPIEITAMEKRINKEYNVSAKVFIYLQAKTAVSSDGFELYSSVSRKIFNKQKDSYQKAVQEIIESSNM